MKILLAGSEVAPIIKLGGLGDVMGSLPKALEKNGINVDIVVPYFPVAKFENKIIKSFETSVPFDGDSFPVEVYKTKLPDSSVDVFLLKNDRFFGAGGSNAFANNISETEMFTFFSRAVVEFIKAEFNTYDIVHCNDWHTGLVTHLLADELGNDRPRTLFTIHNLLYQGKSGTSLVQQLGIVPGAHALVDWDVSDGDINLMLQGVTSADFINTVSPSYAKEILTEEFGHDLAIILQSREGRLSGILNGIDPSGFNRNYDVTNWKKEKAVHKHLLQEKLNLKQEPDKPLYAFISRLDPNQKGLDLLFEIIPNIVKNGGQFVLLGTGDPVWEQKFKYLVQKSSDKEDLTENNTSINVRFDVKFAEELYAGSDFTLIPSKYEPCGLVQMNAMWYGSVPIVRGVGGLKDSVRDGVNGYVFDGYSSEEFWGCIEKSMKLYKTVGHEKMVENAMKTDFSWYKSGREYIRLYEKLLS